MPADLAVIGLSPLGLPLAQAAVAAGIPTIGYRTGAEAGSLSPAELRRMLSGGFRPATDPAELGRVRTAVICAPTPRDAEGGAFDLHPARDLGDFVLRRRDGAPSYQLASVLDDEESGINFIVRGLDLMPSTGAQLALAASLGLSGFPQARFWHHALVLDANKVLRGDLDVLEEELPLVHAFRRDGGDRRLRDAF